MSIITSFFLFLMVFCYFYIVLSDNFYIKIPVAIFTVFLCVLNTIIALEPKQQSVEERFIEAVSIVENPYQGLPKSNTPHPPLNINQDEYARYLTHSSIKKEEKYYCSNCNTEVLGQYCYNCGTKIGKIYIEFK